MIQASTLVFLKGLKKNNDKAWMDDHRGEYLAAKEDFEKCTAAIIEQLGKKDPDISGLDPKKCLFRINRDIRFSKDKSPYKTNMGASMSKGGKKISLAGYYFHLEPGKSMIAGGMYMPASPELAQIRQEIDYDFSHWKKIVNSKSFKTYFPEGVQGVEILSRPPKGYDENNPAIHYLRMKNFIVSMPLKDELVLGKTLVSALVKAYSNMTEMIHFLNHAIE